MLPQHVLVALVAAVGAVPLNINLGAYSPALVVGDGEISLGSTESASELMATLASGAANGQQGAGQQEGQQQGQQQQQEGEQQQANVEAPAEAEGEQQEGEDQPEEQEAEGENAAKRAPNVRSVDSIGKRSPVADDKIAAIEGAMRWIKRDLQGFNAALSYAREAQKDAPKVELGTGEGGAGVGIIVNAGLNVPANSAANGQPAGGERKNKAKRSEVVSEESEAPKMTLVAITEV